MQTREILEKYGLKKIQRHNRNWMACCPFHKDSNPSFGMNIETGAWQCLGCKVAGPHLVSFVAKMEKCSDAEAAKKIFGGEESEIKYHRIINWVRTKLGADRIDPKETPYIPGNLHLIPWKDSPEANEWLLTNRIDNSTADQYHLQYSTKGTYEGYLALPIWDTQGRIWTYEFRRVKDEGKKVLYLPGAKMSSVVYNLDSIQTNWCYIVEGCKDTWALYQHGAPVVSCFGTHISQVQIKLLISKGIDSVVIFFDGDEAGQDATWGSKKSRSKGAVGKLSEWFDVSVTQCPSGKDPHDLAWEELEDIIQGTKEARTVQLTARI